MQACAREEDEAELLAKYGDTLLTRYLEALPPSVMKQRAPCRMCAAATASASKKRSRQAVEIDELMDAIEAAT